MSDIETIDMAKYAKHKSKGGKVKKIGDPCKKCGTKVILRETRKRKRRKKTKYYYTHYLWCEDCRTIYFVDDYKVDKDVGQQEVLPKVDLTHKRVKELLEKFDELEARVEYCEELLSVN